MDASTIARLKEPEDESRRLKKRYAKERLKADIVAEAVQKSGNAILHGIDCKLRDKRLRKHKFAMKVSNWRIN